MIAMIRKMRLEEAENIGRIHRSALENTFLSSLGIRFLAEMYRTLAKDHKSTIFVAEENEEIAGFISAVEESSNFIKRIVLKSPVRVSLAIGFQIIKKPSIIKKIFQTLSYSKLCHLENADTELLAIAVVPKFQRGGIGSALFSALLQELKAKGIKKLKVLVGQELVSAQNFYKKNNFIFQRTIELYGMRKDILVRNV